MSSILSGQVAMPQQRSGSSSCTSCSASEAAQLPVLRSTTPEVAISSFFGSIANCQVNVQFFTGPVTDASFMDASPEDIQFLTEVYSRGGKARCVQVERKGLRHILPNYEVAQWSYEWRPANGWG